MKPDDDGNYPAMDLGMMDPVALRTREDAEFDALKAIVAKQQAARPKPLLLTVDQSTAESAIGPMLELQIKSVDKDGNPIVVKDPGEGLASGGFDGGALGWVSKEEGNLGRMERAREYKRRRREEFRQQAVAIFTQRRDFLQAAAAVGMANAAKKLNAVKGRM